MVVAKTTTTTITTAPPKSKGNVATTAATKVASEKGNVSTTASQKPTNTSTKPTKASTVTPTPTPKPTAAAPVPTPIEEEKPIYTRPVSSTLDEPVKETEWFNMKIKSGGSFTKISPLLIDSSNLLLSNNNTIKIYNPITGGLKSETSLESNDDMITYITSTYVDSKMTIYLSTEMGKFYTFNLKNKSIEPLSNSDKKNSNNNNNNSEYKKGIVKFVVSPNDRNQIYFINNDGDLCQYNNSTTNFQPIKINELLKNLQFISITNNGKFLVIGSKSFIQVLNLSTTTIQSSKYYKSEYQITSLSILPKLNIAINNNNNNNNNNEVTVSFGTTLGRLNFINYNSENGGQWNFSSYNHWHSTPLISSYYNYDGTMLFTGGFENTLAIWNVSNMRRKVFPRLGGAILHINCDPTSQLIAITLSNNKVQIINISDYKSCSIITGLQDNNNNYNNSNNKNKNNKNNKITSFIEPISNNLIFSGQKNGIIQFYNIRKDRVEKEIIVSPPRNTDISTKKSKGQNLKNGFNGNQLTLEQSLVEPLAFHPSKPLFCSYESFSSVSSDKLESGVVLKDQILKFWETSNEDCKCVFSVTSPHTTNILSMSFHPTKNLLLTTSEKDFKLWRKQSMEAIDGDTNLEKFYWTCIYEGSYRGLVCSASAFSKDGSIFAVACDHLVTLWDSETMSPLDILSFSSCHIVHELSFLNGGNQLLVSYKDNGAIVWDIKKKSPVKVYTFPIKPITVCDEFYSLCPSTSRDRLMIFSSNSHQLLFTTQVPIPKSQVIEQVLFSKDQQNYDCILCITNETLVYGYSTYRDTNRTTASAFTTISNKDYSDIPSSSGFIQQSISNSNYYKSKKDKRQKIIENQTTTTTTTPTTSSTTTTNTEDSLYIGKEIFTQLPSTQEMFGAASHIIPSVQNIYQKYMDSILVNSNNLTVSNSTKKERDEDNINVDKEIKNNNNIDKEENNVKKQSPQLSNTNKFSSMKNFFDNLEEPIEETNNNNTTTTTTTTTTSATTASSAATKETKTKSTSSSVKKRKGPE
ncbi:hypothetical protein RB653_007268 [Dictyostelium firmibasis]|uniref:WD repeat-containing protein 75 second beta-propeller domain-containing protein n=1 Tax=Dictyostelium firmibasis TaxID=79012 RepID=A0AAN7YUI0_9MYCE